MQQKPAQTSKRTSQQVVRRALRELQARDLERLRVHLRAVQGVEQGDHLLHE